MVDKQIIEKYTERMKELKKESLEMDHEEYAHVSADDLLCEALTELGFTEMIKIYDEMPMSYG